MILFFLDLINFVILQILNYLSPFFPAKRNNFVAKFLLVTLFFLASPENSIAVSVIFGKEHLDLHLGEVAPGEFQQIKRSKEKKW